MDKSVIPACDVPFDILPKLVKETSDLPGIGGYKIGAALCLSVGLPAVVEAIRSATDKPIIYDHQKAGTDIPDTAEYFMAVLAANGVDKVILFPQAGPATQRAWTAAAEHENLDVIVGGLMTHKSYLAPEGYLRQNAPGEMYRNAAASGVNNFVVPGNQPSAIIAIRSEIEKHASAPVFYAPGFIRQGGKISDAALAAGGRWHAIVGRGIYEAPDMRAAAEDLCSAL